MVRGISREQQRRAEMRQNYYFGTWLTVEK